jgi:hypothetical protein
MNRPRRVTVLEVACRILVAVLREPAKRLR